MQPSTAWAYLLFAGFLEIFWALFLKHTHGFSRFWPSAGVLSIMAVSFYFLSQSLKVLPIGIAYAVWTGIGAAGTAIAGILFFHEPFSLMRVFCVFLIIAGIAGLKITS